MNTLTRTIINRFLSIGTVQSVNVYHHVHVSHIRNVTVMGNGCVLCASIWGVPNIWHILGRKWWASQWQLLWPFELSLCHSSHSQAAQWNGAFVFFTDESYRRDSVTEGTLIDIQHENPPAFTHENQTMLVLCQRFCKYLQSFSLSKTGNFVILENFSLLIIFFKWLWFCPCRSDPQSKSQKYFVYCHTRWIVASYFLSF